MKIHATLIQKAREAKTRVSNERLRQASEAKERDDIYDREAKEADTNLTIKETERKKKREALKKKQKKQNPRRRFHGDIGLFPHLQNKVSNQT